MENKPLIKHRPHPLLIYGLLGFVASVNITSYPILGAITFLLLLWMILSRTL